MAELRQDPILGDHVIIAPERATRPFDSPVVQTSSNSEICPFCQGNESATPDAVMTVANGDSSNDWLVRIIPNRYPAVSAAMPEKSVSEYFEMTPASGYHEVIIESPSHQRFIRELSAGHLLTVVRAWRDRLAVVCSDDSIAHTMIFKNEGPPAGASLEHVHSQLLATSFVPSGIDAELEAGSRRFEETKRQPWTEMLDQEFSVGTRVIAENEQFVLLCPFASRFPGEMRLLPRTEVPGFETSSDTDLTLFAGLLGTALSSLDVVFPDAPLNLGLHTAPPRDSRKSYYRWHLSITPRLTGIAGFEIASGSWINIIAPEDAAGRYRSAIEQIDSP